MRKSISRKDKVEAAVKEIELASTLFFRRLHKIFFFPVRKSNTESDFPCKINDGPIIGCNVDTVRKYYVKLDEQAVTDDRMELGLDDLGARNRILRALIPELRRSEKNTGSSLPTRRIPYLASWLSLNLKTPHSKTGALADMQILSNEQVGP